MDRAPRSLNPLQGTARPSWQLSVESWGLNFIPVIDQFVSPVESFLRAQCERIVKVKECDDSGGYLKIRIRMVKSLLSQFSGAAYWPNQYENLDVMEAHYCLTGGEICRRLREVDYVFIGVGST